MKTVYGPFADIEAKASVHSFATDIGAQIPLMLTGCSRAMAKALELNAREDGTAPDWMGWAAEYHPGSVRHASGADCAACGQTPAEGWFAVLRLGDAKLERAPWLCRCLGGPEAAERVLALAEAATR